MKRNEPMAGRQEALGTFTACQGWGWDLSEPSSQLLLPWPSRLCLLTPIDTLSTSTLVTAHPFPRHHQPGWHFPSAPTSPAARVHEHNQQLPRSRRLPRDQSLVRAVGVGAEGLGTHCNPRLSYPVSGQSHVRSSHETIPPPDELLRSGGSSACSPRFLAQLFPPSRQGWTTWDQMPRREREDRCSLGAVLGCVTASVRPSREREHGAS